MCSDYETLKQLFMEASLEKFCMRSTRCHVCELLYQNLEAEFNLPIVTSKSVMLSQRFCTLFGTAFRDFMHLKYFNCPLQVLDWNLQLL